MQAAVDTIFAVSKPTKKNFQFPPPIELLFGVLTGDKKQWVVVSAAILAFAELSEEDRRAAISRVAHAEALGEIRELVAPIVDRLEKSQETRHPKIASIRDDAPRTSGRGKR
jgi:hypothetical protein